MRSSRAAPGKNSLSIINQDLEAPLLQDDLNDIFL
jgi:hypothetical protein